jgi:peptidoglycan/xylan/chitin deacetylase (PgdA/CDA1 family)
MRRLFHLLGISLLLGAIAPFAASQSSLLAAQSSPAQPAAPPRLPQLSRHPVVALTFDDLPSAGALPAGDHRARIATTLTSELKANHLEGTYGFVNAVRLENDPDAQQALRIWIDAGMNIGNHTWSHASLTENTAKAYESEIARGEPALAQYAGERDWHWFRYPYLAEGETLEKRNAVRAWLSAHGYHVAQVTLSFDDYAWNDAYGRCVAKQDAAAIAWLRQSYLENATEYIQLGRRESAIAFHREGRHEIPHVMLLHAMAFTTLMLPDLIELMRNEGFRFAQLPKVEQDPVYAQNPDAALHYGTSFPSQFMDSRHLTYPPFTPHPNEKLQSLCR